jgi:FKBP-type peptidyl-prolyl cis-trans isomerase
LSWGASELTPPPLLLSLADDRNQPFDFTLGAGNVIKGWDLGVAGMCPGEVRKLKVRESKGVDVCVACLSAVCGLCL